MRNPHSPKENLEARLWVRRRLIWEGWLDGVRADHVASPGRGGNRDV